MHATSGKRDACQADTHIAQLPEQRLECQPPPVWRSRNSGLSSLRASGASKLQGSNQWIVRAAANRGGMVPVKSGFSGHRSCHKALRSGTRSKQSSSFTPPLQFVATTSTLPRQGGASVRDPQHDVVMELALRPVIQMLNDPEGVRQVGQERAEAKPLR